MTKKFIHSFITIIGGCGAALGFSNCVSYMTGMYNLPMLYGQVPMAFSTSFVTLFFGIAIFLTGKSLEKHEQALGDKFDPIDLIALVLVSSCIITMAIRGDTLFKEILITIVGFYFGRHSKNSELPKNNSDNQNKQL